MNRICFFVLCLMGAAASLHAQLTFRNTVSTGEISVNDTVYSAHFIFENTGDTPVVIEDIKSSCGCTTATRSKKTYRPGEQGSIDAVFEFGHRKGEQHKEITVVTDQGIYGLSIEVDIPEKFTVSKRSHSWELDSDLDPWTFEIRLHPDWKATFQEITSKKDLYSLTVTQFPDESLIRVMVAPKDTSVEARDIINVFLATEQGDRKNISVFLSVR